MSSGQYEIREAKDEEEEDKEEEEEEEEGEEEEEEEPESESEDEEEEEEPCALVDILKRVIFRAYAGSGRVGIERSEIVSMLKATFDNPITIYDTRGNSMISDMNINEAIRGACHAPVYALYKTGSFDHFNTYKGMVRELDLLKVLPKKTRDERFKAQLIKDVDYIALADYLDLSVECIYEDDELENDKIVDEYVLNNAHTFAVVGLPRSNYDTFDNGHYPQCDQQSRIIRVIS